MLSITEQEKSLLDRNSSGLLKLTNDNIAEMLSHM